MSTRLRNSCLLLLLVLIGACTSKNNIKFTVVNNNCDYQLISFNEQGNTAKSGDLVEFKAMYVLNNKIELEHDSTYLNELFNDTISINNNIDNCNLQAVLKLLQEDDSCLIRVYNKIDACYRVAHKSITSNKNDTLYIYLKVKRIYNATQRQEYLLEENAIARYISFSNQQWQANENGIFYHILNKGDGAPLKYGDLTGLVYKGYFLNHQVFDPFAEINPYFEHVVGTQNQLIPGMELALKQLSYNAEAEFIFPSTLGFGKTGSSTGIVKAYKPLLYKVKVLRLPLQ